MGSRYVIFMAFVLGTMVGSMVSTLSSFAGQEVQPNNCPMCPKCAKCTKCPKCPDPPAEKECASSAMAVANTAPDVGGAENDATELKMSVPIPTISNSIVVTEGNKYIGLVQPVLRLDENGKLPLPPGTKRIALDLGSSMYSPSGQRWFRRGDGDDLAVIAVEPHPFAFSLLAYTSHPIMMNNPRSFMFYYPPCRSGPNGEKMVPHPEQWYTACFNRSHRDLFHRRDRFFPLNAAVSNKAGFAPFNLGAGDSGVGSLYEFRHGSKWEKKNPWGWTQVPTIRMDHILQFLPDGLDYEIVKIDAQGHDAEVITGVGQFITRFKCVIGEFDIRAGQEEYEGTENAKKAAMGVDYRKFLKGNGFLHVELGLWVNTRFKKEFLASEYMCTAWDINVVHWRILSTLGIPKSEWPKTNTGVVR